MSVIVALHYRKGNDVVYGMASDSLVGAYYEGGNQVYNVEKKHYCYSDGVLVGFAGAGIYVKNMKSIMEGCDEDVLSGCCLRDQEKFFCGVAMEKCFKDTNGDTGGVGLIVNQWGVLYLDGYFGLARVERNFYDSDCEWVYMAAGCGREYALGSLMTQIDINRQGSIDKRDVYRMLELSVDAANRFSPYCGGAINVDTYATELRSKGVVYKNS